MSSNTFLIGLARVLNCPKVHVAATGLVTTWFAVRFAVADLPPTQRASLWVAFIAAVAVQLREIINAWTEEDVANAQNADRTDSFDVEMPTGATSQPPRKPVATVSPASTATAPITGARSTIAAPPRPPLPRPLQRSPDMPARTKLPLLLIASSAITMLVATGCQTSPEMTAYREGLHGVDEPLYQAHLLLLDDAVKTGLRTDADRQVVRAGIAAARDLYAESKKGEAATPPATTMTAQR